MRDEPRNPAEETSPEVTVLLRAWRAGSQDALQRLMPIVYEQLRKIAHRYMRLERHNHTLGTTALVHEAYLRMIPADIPFSDRAHFLSIAALTMRRILVDHANALRAKKRGGSEGKTQLDESAGPFIPFVDNDPTPMLDLDAALKRLAAFDERKARLLELLYFGGLTVEESAEVAGISAPTAHRDLKMAKAWLRIQLGGSPGKSNVGGDS